MLELEGLLESLVRAARGDAPEREARALVSEAVADPTRLQGAFGAPGRAGVERLHVADDLTVLNVI